MGSYVHLWTNEATPGVFPTLHIVLCSGDFNCFMSGSVVSVEEVVGGQLLDAQVCVRFSSFNT